MADLTPLHTNDSRFIELFDRENPRSLINLVPPVVKLCLEELEKLHPQYLNLCEEDLKEVLYGRGKEPPRFDNMLRIQFWGELYRAQRKGGAFSIPNVYHEVCSPATFYKYIRHPKVLAWLICPLTDYLTSVTEMLTLSISQMRDILILPNLDIRGNPNVKLLETKLKVFMVLDARKNGMVVQRVENKNMNLNLTADAKDVQTFMEQMTLEQIDTRIKQLEKKDIPLIPDTLVMDD